MRRPIAGRGGAGLRAPTTIVCGALALLAARPATAATIARTFGDAPGVGFNDMTPAAPVGGNPGTTIGQQRRNVVDRALDIWAARLQSPQTINVGVTFNGFTLDCTPGGAVLGSATAAAIFRYTGAAGSAHPIPNVWYVAALYNRLTDSNMSTPMGLDVLAAFNGRVGTAGCAQSLSFYYGLDGQPPGPSSIDLLGVVLHEFAHAVGFGTSMDGGTGQFPQASDNNRYPDSFSNLLYDNTQAKRWPALTAAQRLTSARNTGNLLWDGSSLTAAATHFPPPTNCTGGGGRVRMYAPGTFDPGSSISHFDTSCTPSLLMEPFAESKPLLDATPFLLTDIGWGTTGACGDGTTDAGEQCDDGAANGTAPSACGALCLLKSPGSCGNGAINASEQCDDGAANGSPFSCCSSTCTFRAMGTTCRSAAGPCDLAEVCTGSSSACPADGLRDSSMACRGAAGPCDSVEYCTGVSASCPQDLLAVVGSECRAAAGPCDVAETCPGGTPLCPTDALKNGTECRASVGPCDVAEICSGQAVTCPADVLQPAGMECRASAGTCDVAEVCSGQAATCPADGFRTAGMQCRASAGTCDVAEVCSGAAAACPADGFATGACNDGNACTTGETCTAGVCGGGAAVVCPVPGECQLPGVCQPATGACQVSPRPDGTACLGTCRAGACVAAPPPDAAAPPPDAAPDLSPPTPDAPAAPFDSAPPPPDTSSPPAPDAGPAPPPPDAAPPVLVDAAPDLARDSTSADLAGAEAAARDTADLAPGAGSADAAPVTPDAPGVVIPPLAGHKGGCDCRVGSARDGAAPPALLAGLLLAVLVRRRRR